MLGPRGHDPAAALDEAGGRVHTADLPAAAAPVVGSCAAQADEDSDDEAEDEDGADGSQDDTSSSPKLQEGSAANIAQDGPIAQMEELALSGSHISSSGRSGAAAAPHKRASHKFQKKAARTKKRGQMVDGANGAHDGSGVAQGKRGGVVRA
ncbi:hypothetical protein WJX84_012351 [Apatococcus fuscideae]|uniref:Uncharacterized protein n=1 Tax=Apatococcus fuscideae TaxID=2026836 RepID=A0AAW1S199_9CHLO